MLMFDYLEYGILSETNRMVTLVQHSHQSFMHLQCIFSPFESILSEMYLHTIKIYTYTQQLL